MAIYIILKSETNGEKACCCCFLPYFYSPNFSKEWKGPFIPPTCTWGRRTTTLMEKSMMLEMNL